VLFNQKQAIKDAALLFLEITIPLYTALLLITYSISSKLSTSFTQAFLIITSPLPIIAITAYFILFYFKNLIHNKVFWYFYARQAVLWLIFMNIEIAQIVQIFNVLYKEKPSLFVACGFFVLEIITVIIPNLFYAYSS
jgi:hypothetical protein